MATDNPIDHAPAAVWEPLTALKPWAANPRDNTKAVAEVAKSIRRFGWGAPIVANKRDGEIIAGHTRFAAAERLKLDQVPVRWLDLDPADAHALALADNKVGEVATWDDATLRQVLAELKAADESLLADTGFSDEELAALLGEVTPTVLEPEGEPPEVDEAGPVHSVPGEVYELGPHRLMCGDSTSVDAVDRLMAGDKADMVFTDPPYNIGYQDLGHKFEKIANDKMNDSEFVDFLRSTLLPCEVMYVCCSWQYAHLFKQVLAEMERPAKAMIVWNKVNRAQNLDLYYKQHEIIFYHGPFGGQATIRGDVWELKRQRNTLHPTMKPVELIEMALQDHPNRKIVFDGFGGSGSTLIACAQSGRMARLMELDPRYCDVIRRRWTRWAKANGVDAGSGALDG